jgi:hypothetical protein
MYTDEVDDEASVGGSASGAAKEGLAVREVVERDDRKHWCGELDEIARVGVRVAEGEDGVNRGAAARVRLSVMHAGDEENENY